jgi:hypothetical protein
MSISYLPRIEHIFQLIYLPKTQENFDDLTTALANLAEAERELDRLNNDVERDIHECQALIAM